jgi:hypothetical protein
LRSLAGQQLAAAFAASLAVSPASSTIF